ncbi:MAG: carboxy terminal-processing peptidase [Firmicutes bacterium]|nr:carboxy terminal-processing peptidase [Bacillota bacterium]
MRKPILKILIPLLIVVLLIYGITAADTFEGKDTVVAMIMMQALENWHYNQVKLNDNFSRTAFANFLKELDPNKRFFLKSDIEQLKRFQNKIDDELRTGEFQCLELASEILKKRIAKVQSIYQEILKEPFDFSDDEELEFDAVKRDYCANETEQRELWRKILEYRALVYYLSLEEGQKESQKRKSTSKSKLPAFNPKLEKQAREKLARSLKREFQILVNKTDKNRLEQYLNSIAATFDPHTRYFLPEEAEDFETGLSGTLEGIGAILEADGEYVKVNEIVPGSAAWRQGELKAGDLIMKVGQAAEEPVDISYMPLTEVVKLIRGKKGTEVRLTVKKADGRIMVIPIIRDVVIIEEAYAKAAVIDNRELGKKFGYIYLPSFYHDYKSKNGRGAAADVRKQLQIFKAEKVDGVILDLRNNFGGILEDAVSLSGLFIKNGPIVQVKNGAGYIEVLNDPDKEIVYDGPLVVLINSLSASAAEIVAAALQDYGRAIIMGSPASYGKGTVQIITDLDRFLGNEFSILKPLGSLKLTIQKYYRITGGSVQGKGVVSDIPLPDIYEHLEREKDLDNALPWDTIPPTLYRKWLTDSDLKEIKTKSAKRVNDNPSFKLIAEHVERVKKRQAKTSQSLQLAKVFKEQNLLKQEAENVGKYEERAYLEVTVLNDFGFSKEASGIEKQKEWRKQVASDPYIDEAMFVLEDVINQ